MNVFLWIDAAVLAAVFVGTGVLKLVRSRDEVAALGQHWVEDFSPGLVKGIGVLELLGAVGVVVPPLVGVAPVLAPVAATGIVLLMAGATLTHARRGEWGNAAGTAVLLVMAALVVWGRFGPYPF
jgi:hypothetical protein